MRKETTRAYVATLVEGKGYARNLPWCNRCKTHHQQGSCPPKCGKCNRIGHQEKDCRTRMPAAGGIFLQNVTCYGCRENGHFRNKCPKGRNQQNEGARARACMMGTENPQQNPNVVTVTPFIDIAPAALGTSYEVELADGK
ncbi:putative reverse transcriptase domain-containing protein, partial [Tanacetum coccineum]